MAKKAVPGNGSGSASADVPTRPVCLLGQKEGEISAFIISSSVRNVVGVLQGSGRFNLAVRLDNREWLPGVYPIGVVGGMDEDWTLLVGN